MPPDDLRARVTALEGEVARIRSEVREAGADAKAARYLASGADHDVTSVRDELRAHTRVINAMREDHVEFKVEMYAFREEMYAFREEMYGFREQVNRNFEQVDANFGEVTRQFVEVNRQLGTVRVGVEQIIGLIDRPPE